VALQIQQLAQQARELMRTESLDLDLAIGRAIDQFAESGQLQGSEPQAASLTRAQLAGFGELQPLLDDPEVEEIWLNDPQSVNYWRDGSLHRDPLSMGRENLKTLIYRMLRESGRRLDRSQPFVDAALPDGSRLHVVIPEVTREWSINIRKFRREYSNLETLVDARALTAEQAQQLRDVTLAGQSILITGATQAGKTTLLRALLQELPASERIVSVEDTFELNLEHPDWVGMQTVASSVEGGVGVDLRELVRQSLRMRPSRLVIGEVRGAESLDLLIALNSGLPGMCTLHANSARGGVMKLMTLPLLAGENITREFLRSVVPTAFSFAVHCSRDQAGKRAVREIVRVADVFDG
jgi:pilus assembly protein CpaF